MGLKSPTQVESFREKVYSCLEEYCKQSYPNEPTRFAKMLLRLPALRSIGIKCLDSINFIPPTPSIASFVQTLNRHIQRSSSTNAFIFWPIFSCHLITNVVKFLPNRAFLNRTVLYCKLILVSFCDQLMTFQVTFGAIMYNEQVYFKIETDFTLWIFNI